MKTKELLQRLETLNDTLMSSTLETKSLRDMMIDLVGIVADLAMKQQRDATRDEV